MAVRGCPLSGAAYGGSQGEDGQCCAMGEVGARDLRLDASATQYRLHVLETLEGHVEVGGRWEVEAKGMTEEVVVTLHERGEMNPVVMR
jgi:hypothetical protein